MMLKSKYYTLSGTTQDQDAYGQEKNLRYSFITFGNKKFDV